MKNTGLYANLLAQFRKIYVHNRQGSYRTRARYGEAYKRLLTFLADKFRLEKISNISPKHLYAYVDYLTTKGLSPAYIKTELSAIRFFHDQIPNAKYQLPDNSHFPLTKRNYLGIDRTWSTPEFNRLNARAVLFDENYIAIFYLARYAGLRLHECFRLDTATATDALKTGRLTIKGKGGLMREIPINERICTELYRVLEKTSRGNKLFVKPEEKTHLAMHRLENFISDNRDKIQAPDAVRPITFHGLRHTCAAQWYSEFLSQGYTELEARKKVARLLGHGRDDVTRIYIASVEKGGPTNVQSV